MNEETPVIQDAVISPRPATAEEAKAVEAAKEPVKGPAHELRQVQALLAGGIFPGQMAPAIVDAFKYVGQLADKIELDAKHEAEFKARQKA